MKKIYLITILFFYLAFSLNANPVDAKKAKEVALNFIKAKSGKSNVIFENEIKYGSIDNPELYGYTLKSGGFIIIAGDDASNPILAYSFDKNSELALENQTNTGFINWLKSYENEIKYIREKDLDNQLTKQKWNDAINGKFRNENSKEVNNLISTTWDQGKYYNALCPQDANAGSGYDGRVPNGCVAVAMAQVMKYHEWPAKGTKNHSYTHKNYGAQTADFAATTYNWNNMPNYLSNYNDDVAKLIYHCGVAVEMNYAADGSGAFSEQVPFALFTYFGYSPLAQHVYKANYTENQWKSLLKYELDNERPIYYDGSSSAGGHAFICSGYDDSDRFYFNWGWGGSGNGFFYIGSLNPGGSNFNETNGAIINLKPHSESNNSVFNMQVLESKDTIGIDYIDVIDDNTVLGIAFYEGHNKTTCKLIKTANAGTDWLKSDISISTTNTWQPSMISAVNDQVAFIPAFYTSTSGGQIMKTSNGGTSWETSKEFESDGFPNVVHFWDENYGYCQGDPTNGELEVYYTENGGTSWTRVANDDIPDPQNSEYGTVGYYDVVGDITWFTTNKGRVFKSEDKGKTWTSSTVIAGKPIKAHFSDENNGYAIKLSTDDDSSVKLFKSEDGGTTWNEIEYNGIIYSNDFKVIKGTNSLISVGSGVTVSNDGGLNWTKVQSPYGFGFTCIDVVNEKLAWLGTYCTDELDGIYQYLGLPAYADFKSKKLESLTNTDITIENLSKVEGTSISYAWDFGTDATPATANTEGPHTVQYSSLGQKTVKLTVTVDGTDYVEEKKKYINVVEALDVKELKQNTESINLYPNPSKDYIKITVDKNCYVEIYSQIGQKIKGIDYKKGSNINISNLKSGNYILRAHTKNGIVNKNFIVIK